MKSPHLFGKYLLLDRVSVGGMAEIFIAKAFGVEGFERILAIKKILPTMAEDEEFITMFIDEARISSALNHANIVHIHELGRYDGAYFIAMEYVAGLDVKLISEMFRRERQPFPVAQAVFIASKICEGLDYAHRANDGRGQPLNIVHRDVSPQNILVSYEGEVKIIDFGIAKAANRRQETQVGILKGKFGYMSPEQALGKPIDRRSDLFAVGVILYEMLTGDRLFVGESDFSVVDKVRNVNIVAPRELNPDIPKGLEKVILKALAKETADRYQWCSELQEDLLRYLVSDGQVYSTKQLAAFMKEVFAEDLAREAERMQRFAGVERPEQLEDSSVGDATRRRPSKQVPLAAPPTAPTAPAVPATPQKRADSGGFRAARPPPPVLEPLPKGIPFSAVPTSRQPTVPDSPPSVVVTGVDRTQVFDAMGYQESLQPKAQVIIGEKVVSGPTVIGAVPVRQPPRLEPVDPSVVADLPAALGAAQAGSYPFGAEETPIQGKLLEDSAAPSPWPSDTPGASAEEGDDETAALPPTSRTNRTFPPLPDEHDRARAPAMPRIDAAPTQTSTSTGFGSEDEMSFEPTRLRPSGEKPAIAEPQAGEGSAPPEPDTSPGTKDSPDPWDAAGRVEQSFSNETQTDIPAETEADLARALGFPDFADRAPGPTGEAPAVPAAGPDAFGAAEPAGATSEESGAGSEPTRISEGAPNSEQGEAAGPDDVTGQQPQMGFRPTRLSEQQEPLSAGASDAGERQDNTDPAAAEALASDLEETPTPSRIPAGALGFDDDGIPKRPTNTRSGDTRIGPMPLPPEDEPPPEEHTDPDASMSHGAGAPPIGKGKPPTKTRSSQLPARRPTSSQRAAPKASAGIRWAIIGASAAGILVAVGLLAFALSGGSENALLVIAEPREGVRIAVDGMAFPNGQVVTPFPEGDHELVVSGIGYKTATQHIQVGGRSTFQVRLVPEAPAPAPEPTPANPPEPSAPDHPTEATPAKGADDSQGSTRVAAAPAEPTAAKGSGKERAHTEAAEPKKPRAERPPDVKTSRTTTTRPTEAASKKKKTGTLACTSNPLGAEVIIDGRPTGRRTPVPFGSAIELPVGKHKLMLKSGAQSVTATIEIREGEVTTIRNAVLQ